VAAEAKGQATAEDVLPDLPAECYQDVAHAALVAGAEARSQIARERGQTAAANASKRRCAAFYANLKAGREKL